MKNKATIIMIPGTTLGYSVVIEKAGETRYRPYIEGDTSSVFNSYPAPEWAIMDAIGQLHNCGNFLAEAMRLIWQAERWQDAKAQQSPSRAAAEGKEAQA